MSGVKGTAIASVVEDVNRLVLEGKLSREALDARLEAADLEVLEQKIVPALWYPIRTYGRLVQVLFEVEGRRKPDYLIERGRRAAERIRATGLYSQLSAGRGDWGDRIGKILVSLGPAMFKDSIWSFHILSTEGPLRWRIDMQVEADFPDLCRYSTQGFIDYLSAVHGGDRVRVSSERSAPTRISFFGDPL
jgi:hypothetical protein